MSTKSDGIGVTVGSSKKGVKRVSGRVEVTESKTLGQDSVFLGQVGGKVLIDEVKVSEESKGFVGGERGVDVKSGIGLGEGRRGIGFKMTDRFDETKNRVVEMMSRDDGRGSWGVMNLVGKVLGGKSFMDDETEDGTGNDINSIVSDEVEDVKKLEIGNDINSGVADEVVDLNNFDFNNDGNSDVDWKVWQNVIGESVFENGRVVSETVISTDLDNKIHCSSEGAGLTNVKKSGTRNVINTVVADEVEDVKKVGIKKDINSVVADDVEDVKDSGTNNDGNGDVNWDVWQNVIGDPVFEDRRIVNKTVNCMDLDSKLVWSCEGAGLSNVKKYGTRNDIDSTVDDEVEDVKKLGTGNDINNIVANEVEDVKNFGNNHDGNISVDWITWQNVTVVEDGMSFNETVTSTDLDNKLDCSFEGAGLSEKQHMVINEQVPDGGLENKGLNNANITDVLLQSGRGEECVTKKEGEYSVSDLVWGKVRSHPWWPGQILPPSAASDKAMKLFKEDTYLIAYFGDQTFAWNEVSKIKPFRTLFSEMEKQSYAESFCRGVGCALDEVARRVELGLSCQCLAKEVHITINSQVIQNAGVKEESSIRYGGDCLSAATSFVPGDLLQFLKSLAEAPTSKTDRLQFGIKKAQFLAFSRWKGCHQLLSFEQHYGLFGNDAQFTMEEGGRSSRDLVNGGLVNSIDAIKVPSRKRKFAADGISSRKRKHVLVDELSEMKEKCAPVLATSANTCLQAVERNKVKSGMKTVSAGKKRGLVNSFRNAKRKKSMPRPSDAGSSQTICSGGGSETRFNAGISTVEEMIPGEFNPDEILLKLNSAAINPKQGFFILTPVMGLLRQIRNSACLMKSEGTKPFSLETTDLHVEGSKDSYWTDKIIEGNSQEQVILEPETPVMKDASGAELGDSICTIAILDDQKQKDSVNLHGEAENSSAQVDEGSEEHFPTALLLNFTKLDSIPPVENLNEIFRRYGPLDETQTKILSKSKRAKVVFKKRADAETAFSSTGKYSIFGPSLLSYRLHCAPSKFHAAAKGRSSTHP